MGTAINNGVKSKPVFPIEPSGDVSVGASDDGEAVVGASDVASEVGEEPGGSNGPFGKIGASV